jgi:hypothetical protein
MKIDRNQGNKRAWLLLVLLLPLMMLDLPGLHGESVILPGDVSRICYYSNYFYNFPSEDFLYYLNDRLLFSERPEDFIVPNGLRDRLLQLVAWHKELKKYVLKHAGEKKNSVSFNLIDPDQYDDASQLFSLMGYRLGRNDKGQYYLAQVSGPGMAGYLDFSLVRPQVLEQQLNRSHTFYFHLKESESPLPPGLDLAFLSEVTGLKIDALSFFEAMLKNERLSLLLGVLYRLSGNEVGYLKQLSREKHSGVWKQIYNDKKLLMGLFVLSNALRAEQVQADQYRLVLPGGEAAASFWSQMAGDQLKPGSFEFLQRLATKDDGKLNYLYVFSYFLPEETRKALFFDYDAAKVTEIYNRISLQDNEKLTGGVFPGLEDWNYFILMYALRTENGQIYFPQGSDAWLKAIKNDPSEPAATSASLVDLMTALLEGKGSGQMSEMRRFMALYTKFSHRPELLGQGNLLKLVNDYDKYNGLVDFMEKIPLKKPETVSQLLAWVRRLEALGIEDKQLFTELYQSLLEILAFTAKYAPDLYDWDLLVSELIKLPLNRGRFYRELFQFFATHLNIKPRALTPLLVMLKGISNSTVKIGETKYKFMIKDAFQKAIHQVLQSQDVCSFSDLLEINRLLDEGLTTKPPFNSSIGGQIREMFLKLPYPGISEDAPKAIRERVIPYSQGKLNKVVKSFVDQMLMGAERSQLQEKAAELKSDYLIYQLRDHLLCLVYAVNAKDANLKAFLNPNFVRLHDISSCNGNGLWTNECKNPRKKTDLLSDYYLSGGLFRLNLAFASRWQEHLFRENILLNPSHVQAVITNVLDLYPLPRVTQVITYEGLLVELGLGLLREAVESSNTAIKQDVLAALATITAGYHYRQAMSYLNGESNHHNLYFSEISRLGRVILNQSPGREYLAQIPAWQSLQAFAKPPQSRVLKTELDRFGSIYAHTFGNLEPQQIPLFPQEVSGLFSSGWLSGSMIDEFKIKVAYHMVKKQTPPELLGQFLYMYLDTTGRSFLRQNHIKDYPITYFIFDIFNTSHLNNLIKKLKKEGYLKLQ